MCLSVYNSNQEMAEQKKQHAPRPTSHPAEEMALWLKVNQPIVQGIPSVSSSLKPQPRTRFSSTFITGKLAFNSLCTM